ncbi:PD-(D/E)XK nuclease domain-containing protein, partial [Megasphaera stantonii]|uniref:PD-(D/E)XK nuclease domain-containing protein n=1 Tax=Megasphaera stantonii TaxID=2144175 RepID=UPI00195EA9BF
VSQWSEIIHSVLQSDKLLQATWNGDEEAVAKGMEEAHLNTSHLQYNDENALSYTVSLAYYSARQYYTIIRELPTGKGFADMAFLPKKKYADKPAMIVELKWDGTADTALRQIRDKHCTEALKDYKGNIFCVGITYDRGSKKHTCRIETETM